MARIFYALLIFSHLLYPDELHSLYVCFSNYTVTFVSANTGKTVKKKCLIKMWVGLKKAMGMGGAERRGFSLTILTR